MQQLWLHAFERQAQLHRLRSANFARRKYQLTRTLQADGTRQRVGGPKVRHQAHALERHTQAGAGRDEQQVGKQRESEARAEGHAVDGGQDGPVQLGQPGDQRMQRPHLRKPRLRRVGIACGQSFHVAPCAEMRARAANHQYTHRRVSFDVPQRLQHAYAHAHGQGIALSGAVEHPGDHGALALNEQIGIGGVRGNVHHGSMLGRFLPVRTGSGGSA